MVLGWTKGSSRSGSSRGKKPCTSQVANNNNGHTGLLKLAVVDLGEDSSAGREVKVNGAAAPGL